MTTDYFVTTRYKEEGCLPVPELGVEEVFEIMLGCRVKPAAQSEPQVNREFTAMVGLAGALCGVVTVCCDAKTAGQVAKSMLGDTADSQEQVADALVESCNIIAANFTNKLAR